MAEFCFELNVMYELGTMCCAALLVVEKIFGCSRQVHRKSQETLKRKKINQPQQTNYSKLLSLMESSFYLLIHV